MITIFHLFSFCGSCAGIVYGAVLGFSHFGSAGAVLGGIIGLFLGYIVGRIPLGIASMLLGRNLNKTSTEQLKSRIQDEFYITHILIAELAKRGENVEQFFPHVIELLRSSEKDKVRHGIQNLQIWFPRMANSVTRYDFSTNAEEFRAAVNELSQKTPDSRAVEELDNMDCRTFSS